MARGAEGGAEEGPQAMAEALGQFCLQYGAQDADFLTLTRDLHWQWGCEDEFCELLGQAVLAGVPVALPDPLVDELVLHCTTRALCWADAEAGRPQQDGPVPPLRQLELILLRVPVSDQYYEQLEPVLLNYDMYSVVVRRYVQRRDYRRPISLLMAVIDDADDQRAAVAAQALLQYGRDCLLGGGAGVGPLTPDEDAALKRTVVEVLFSHNPERGTSPLLTLLRHSTPQVLALLQAAFLEDSPTLPWHRSQSKRISKQHVVRSLFDAVTDSQGDVWAPPSDTGLLPLQDVTKVYLFCVSQITRGMIQVRRPDTIHRLFAHLCCMCGAGEADVTERERLLQHLLQCSPLAVLDQPGLLRCAATANLGRLVADLHIAAHRPEKALAAYLNDGRPAVRREAFQFLRRMGGAATRPLLLLLEKLAAVDAAATAQLLGERCPAQIPGILRTVPKPVRFGLMEAMVSAADAWQDEEWTQFTDAPEFQEQYVELLCDYQPAAVYGYLKAHRHYRPTECLVPCQERGLVHSMAFLWDAMGMPQPALELLATEGRRELEALREHCAALVTPPGAAGVAPERPPVGPAVPGVVEVVAQLRALPHHAALGQTVAVAAELCERHAGPAGHRLWFACLDVFLLPRRTLTEREQRARALRDDLLKRLKQLNPDMLEDGIVNELQPPVAPVARPFTAAGQVYHSAMQEVYGHHITAILGGMMRHVPFHHILAKVLHAGDTLGPIRGLLVNLAEANQQQVGALQAMVGMLQRDEHTLIAHSVRMRASAFHCRKDAECCVCRGPLQLPAGPSGSRAIFACGHTAHQSCFASPACPVCAPPTPGRRRSPPPFPSPLPAALALRQAEAQASRRLDLVKARLSASASSSSSSSSAWDSFPDPHRTTRGPT